MTEDIKVKREIVLQADAETMERMKKEGHARGFTVYCDEGERIGGDNSAPPPLAYFGGYADDSRADSGGAPVHPQREGVRSRIV